MKPLLYTVTLVYACELACTIMSAVGSCLATKHLMGQYLPSGVMGGGVMRHYYILA